MNIKKIRDLSLLEIDKNKMLIIACDSFGGIGEKENDTLKISLETVGRYLIRVPLIEILCTGAEIISVINILCNEMNPTGKIILKAMREELSKIGVNEDIINGSCEENFKTTMTGAGITVLGIGETDSLKINNVSENADIYSIGIPKLGEEVIDEYGIVTYNQVKSLYKDKNILELVPVGSKGIYHECLELANCNNKTFMKHDNDKIDIYKSSGPSTSIIAAVKKGYKINLDMPINFVGTLE